MGRLRNLDNTRGTVQTTATCCMTANFCNETIYRDEPWRLFIRMRRNPGRACKVRGLEGSWGERRRGGIDQSETRKRRAYVEKRGRVTGERVPKDQTCPSCLCDTRCVISAQNRAYVGEHVDKNIIECQARGMGERREAPRSGFEAASTIFWMLIDIYILRRCPTKVSRYRHMDPNADNGIHTTWDNVVLTPLRCPHPKAPPSHPRPRTPA